MRVLILIIVAVAAVAALCAPLPSQAQGASAIPDIEPGKINELRIGLPELLRRFAGNSRLKPITEALVDVAVPENFDATREWPMLIVSASQDPGYNSSRELMRGFVKPALAAGWVVLAADAAEPLTAIEDDTTGMRFAVIQAGLAALKEKWPDSVHWPLAFGGFSGGAKRSGVLAFLATVEGRVPIGMFLGGCNEPTPAEMLDSYGRPLPQFLKVPVFLSSGSSDRIATPMQHREVERALARAGFTRIRLETYEGPHHLSQDNVRTALEWFAAERGK
jgi:hypothetical protein